MPSALITSVTEATDAGEQWRARGLRPVAVRQRPDH
jgi:hypothetical protein